MVRAPGNRGFFCESGNQDFHDACCYKSGTPHRTTIVSMVKIRRLIKKYFFLPLFVIIFDKAIKTNMNASIDIKKYPYIIPSPQLTLSPGDIDIAD